MDYLIPTISSDFTGLIPRPGQADRTLRWLKDALHRQGALESSTFRQLSWHSFRVFIPDCAYQLGMPRDQRQYLGNWTTESTADIYTREKRKVVQRAWTEVADKLGKLDLSGAKLFPIDLQHQHWHPEVLDLASSPLRESPEKPRSPPFKSRRQALEEKQAASPGSSPGTAAAGAYAPRLPDEPPHGHSLLPPSMPKLNVTHRDLEDWYRWFWGRDIADRRPAPNEQVLLYAERNAWREIHNLVYGGLASRKL
jgi:hypothetical protein